MQTLQQITERAEKMVAELPAIKYANAAIVNEAVRSGTGGYSGEPFSLKDVIRVAIEESFAATTLHERDVAPTPRLQLMAQGWNNCLENLRAKQVEFLGTKE